MDEKIKYVNGGDWARILAKAWVDETFRNALESDPINTIKNDPDVGVDFDRLLCLPTKPDIFSDERLGEIASGKSDAIVIPYSCITICM